MAESRSKARQGLLRHPNFLKLWTAETVSVFGSQISALAIPLVAASYLHVGAFEFALLGVLQFLPFILFTLPAGAWVDRLRRRPIMITGDLGRAIALITIPIVYALNSAWLTIWQLYVVAFVTGTLTVFFDVSNQSYLPSIVERDELIEGNSKLQISQSAAQIGGPGIAGVLIQTIGAPFAVVADALSFVWSACFVFLIRKPEPAVLHPADEQAGNRPSIATDVRQGLVFVLRNPSLRGISFGTASSNLFSSAGQALLLLYVLSELHLGAGQIGVAFALGNVGALVGAFFANRVARWFGLGPTIVGSLFLGGLDLVFVALAPVGGDAVPFLIAGAFFGGLSQMVYNINQVSYRQAICPPRMQGRMNATVRFLVWGTMPIGSLIGGAVASVIGLHETIWIAAILGFIPALFPLLSPVRHLREMPEPVGDDSALPTALASVTTSGTAG
jgi:MFS family permease